ncbi:MAG: DUF456 domain-containing protein [Armatimonadetes bacterium]|nr:DUF456 domain-containing protein [Armatimonadota bacterium]
MSHGTLIAIFALLMLPGVAGVLLPMIPGIPLMFVVAVVFGFVNHWEHLHPWELAILFAIVLLSVLVDYLAGMLGARYGGAGRRATMWGLVGLVVGLLVFPPFGGIIGLFVGVLVAELARGRSQFHALCAAAASLLGSLAGILGNFFLALVFLVSFIIFALH